MDNYILSLDDIIGAKDNFEAKRAIAVKMFRNSFETKDICELLNVSISFVSKWKIIFENEGAEGLLLNYKGSTGFLSDSDRSDIVFHFSDKLHCSIDDVMDYIRNNYGVVYQSKQSYYDIMKEAGLSWHRTQSANPERDEDKVLAKREEIKSKLEEYKDEIESGEVVVYAEDESHLRWGDAEGYVWGQRNERTEVPIKNVAERQTYYGALDIYNGKFVIIFYSLGNGENTVLFIKYLQSLNPGKRLLISAWSETRLSTVIQHSRSVIMTIKLRHTCVIIGQFTVISYAQDDKKHSREHLQARGSLGYLFRYPFSACFMAIVG